MDYSFNGKIAARYGVDEAVFIQNLYWWIAKNEANGRHYHDGRSWTYNSMRAFTELFPFWSEKQVRRIIKKLSDNGAIYIGNYNKSGFDRTQWYALSEEILEVYRASAFDQIDTHIRPNGRITSDQMGGPIPDNKPDNKHIYSAHSSFFERMWEQYPNKRGKGRVSEKKKRELYEQVGEEEFERCIQRYVEDLSQNEWRKAQNGSTFFNSGYVDYLDVNYSKETAGHERMQRFEDGTFKLM